MSESDYGVFRARFKYAMKGVACKVISFTWQLIKCVESIPKSGSLGLFGARLLFIAGEERPLKSEVLPQDRVNVFRD